MKSALLSALVLTAGLGQGRKLDGVNYTPVEVRGYTVSIETYWGKIYYPSFTDIYSPVCDKVIYVAREGEEAYQYPAGVDAVYVDNWDNTFFYPEYPIQDGFDCDETYPN